MFLYNLTLQQGAAPSAVVLGSFSGTKTQELAIARGPLLELLRPDAATGKLASLLVHNVFGIVRSLAAFRLTGASKDYIVVGSDSGRIVILEYIPAKNAFEKVHMETYGKSAVRRTVPGQFLAPDPKGRAVMIAAVEKQKLVYILNRDSAAKLTISSPLEAHKNATLCYTVIGVDVGYDNPIFASIELDYSTADQDHTGAAARSAQTMLTFYELDLGLNHVVRKASEPIDASSNHLIAVPGGTDGPSGVLVCSEGFITWRFMGQPSVRIPIPKRLDPLAPTAADEAHPARSGPALSRSHVLVVASVVHRLKRGFFILVQTELGDVFKVTIDYTSAADGSIPRAESIRIKYFDTIPVASSMCLLKSGFFFVASEFGNHYFYQVENLGDDDETQIEFCSQDFPQDDDPASLAESAAAATFMPRELRNLAPVDVIESPCPLIDAKVLNLLNEDSPQIYALCGRGATSSMRILRHGLEVAEMAVSELPGKPTAVWTVRSSFQDEYDAYIIISFVNATLVLSIGETVEEVTDTGLNTDTSTICAALLGDDALVQVYPQGIRYIRSDRRVSEWRAPGSRNIVRAACSNRQVAIALAGGEIVYFELDISGYLNEFQERRTMPGNVTALAFSPVPEGRQRAHFLCVGCADNTVRMLSLDPESCLQPLGVQALGAAPESLVIAEMTDSITGIPSLYLNTGLQNGVLLRTTIDNVTGALTDTRLRFLGAKAVKLFPVRIQGASAVLALSSRPWLLYNHHERSKLIPLSYEKLEFGSRFCTEQCPEGFVAIVENTLRILSAEKFNNVFNQQSIPLKFTPRRFIKHDTSDNFVIIESDHGTLCPSEKNRRLSEFAKDQNMEDGTLPDELPVQQFGLPKSGPGTWASCIRILNPTMGETLFLQDLDNNEAAFCITTCVFDLDPTVTYVIVGTAVGSVLSPKSHKAAFFV